MRDQLSIGGLNVWADPTMPTGAAELRGPDGRTVGRIEGLGTAEYTPHRPSEDFLTGVFATWLARRDGRERPTKEQQAEARSAAQLALRALNL